MSSKSPEDAPTPVLREPMRAAARDLEIRDYTQREALWLRINTGLLAALFAILAFFGKDLYSDVKTHTVQLATLTERVDDIKEKVDKIAIDTEQDGRSLAEIKGFLQAMRSPSAKENSPENRSSRH